LLGAGLGQASLVFAQTKGSPFDLGSLLKEIVAANGGKGGGTRDMAQGGLPSAALIESALAQAGAKVNS
jgi:alanyl-tRNA synthetase